MSYCIGIDLASENIVISVADPAVPYVPHPLRNELSHDETPNIIAFQRGQYIIGENAQSLSTSNPSNTIKALPYIIKFTNDDLTRLKKQHVDIFTNTIPSQNDSLVFKIENDSLITELPCEVALALIINKCYEISKNDAFPTNDQIAIAIPSNYADREIGMLQVALKLCGLNNYYFVNSSKSVAYFYGSRLFNSNGLIENGKRLVLICDQGSHNTQLTLVSINGFNMELPIVQHVNIGSSDIDLIIYNLLLFRYKQLHDKEITSNEKKRLRILNACSKLKHLLSTLNKADYIIENVLDIDLNVSITRDDITSNGTTYFNQLKELSEPVLKYLEDNQVVLNNIEFIGGGSTSYTMDGSSVVSRGCVSILANHLSLNEKKFNAIIEPIIHVKPIEQVNPSYVELYNKIVERNIKTHQLLEARNKLESYIIQMRDASHNKYKTQLPASELDPLLSSYDDWVMNNENATVEEYENKKKELNDLIISKYPQYYNEIEKEKKEFEAAVQKSAMEKEENDDHDDRKLPKASRKRLVIKNKEEGNELFKDGNLEHAALRYIKALGHCDKFFDLGPEDQQEIKELKVSLYLNISMCYIKLKKHDKALDNLSKALALDENNAKALYRQALCYYEKKMFTESKKSLHKAQTIAPDDAAIAKLITQVDAGIKQQLAKEKQMAKRMFG